MDVPRAAEVERVLAGFTAWACDHVDVVAVGLVGSWARGTAHAESDVDIVVVSTVPEARVAAGDWPAELRAAPVLRRRRWGVLVETRLGMPDGLQVEIGVVPESWASPSPPDSGTARVVRDGLRILYDPERRLAALQRTVAAEAATASGRSGCARSPAAGAAARPRPA